jgi:hypothetical protein
MLAGLEPAAFGKIRLRKPTRYHCATTPTHMSKLTWRLVIGSQTMHCHSVWRGAVACGEGVQVRVQEGTERTNSINGFCNLSNLRYFHSLDHHSGGVAHKRRRRSLDCPESSGTRLAMRSPERSAIQHAAPTAAREESSDSSMLRHGYHHPFPRGIGEMKARGGRPKRTTSHLVR